MKKLRFILLPLIAMLFFASCQEPQPKKGCTDPVAENYNPIAKEDDGSCEYNDSTITIWKDGVEGVWGSNAQTGHIDLQTCYGYALNDTTDTFPGDGLIIVKDSAGNFGIANKIINVQDGRPLGMGYLVFDLLVPSSSALEELDVFINGKTCSDIKMCNDICRSGGVSISTAEIDSLDFTEVSIPLLEFESRYLGKMQTTFGFRENLQGGSDTVMVINNIRWKLRLEEEEE